MPANTAPRQKNRRPVSRDRIKAFYALPHVRWRVAEYLGVEKGNAATCVYLAQPDLD